MGSRREIGHGGNPVWGQDITGVKLAMMVTDRGLAHFGSHATGRQSKFTIVPLVSIGLRDLSH